MSCFAVPQASNDNLSEAMDTEREVEWFPGGGLHALGAEIRNSRLESKWLGNAWNCPCPRSHLSIIHSDSHEYRKVLDSFAHGFPDSVERFGRSGTNMKTAN